MIFRVQRAVIHQQVKRKEPGAPSFFISILFLVNPVDQDSGLRPGCCAVGMKAAAVSL